MSEPNIKRPRGAYVLRITVGSDPAKTGERLQVGLGTGDLVEARARRDICVRALEKALPLCGGSVAVTPALRRALDSGGAG